MDFDLIVIGGGPGGYTAAIYASKLGLKTALVERDTLGGVCLNRGCIPTKVFAHAAELASSMQKACEYGLFSEYDMDVDVLRGKKEQVVKQLTQGVSFLMKANAIKVLPGSAKITSEHTILIDDESTYSAEKIIIATGAESVIPPIPGIDEKGVMFSDEALALKNMPQKVVIIGAGVIGLEFANIYASFGAKVHIVEMMPVFLPMLDADVSKTILDGLRDKGIGIQLSCQVTQVLPGPVVCYKDETGQDQRLDCDSVLVSVGRKPIVPSIIGIPLETTKKGITVDQYLRTNIESIYAIGDVNGLTQLAHAAAHQGIIAVKNILGERKRYSGELIPKCIYISPEVAWVGLSEAEAMKKGISVQSSVFPMNSSGRAMTMGSEHGLIKIVADMAYGQILGAQLVCPSASEMIHEIALAMQMEATADDLAEMIHAHPSLSEGIMEACMKIGGKSINLL